MMRDVQFLKAVRAASPGGKYPQGDLALAFRRSRRTSPLGIRHQLGRHRAKLGGPANDIRCGAHSSVAVIDGSTADLDRGPVVDRSPVLIECADGQLGVEDILHRCQRTQADVRSKSILARYESIKAYSKMSATRGGW